MQSSPDAPIAALKTAFQEATALHKAGQLQDAITRYESLLESLPSDAELLYRLGSAYTAAEQYDRAIPFLERSIAAKPDFIHAIEMLGSTWIRSGAAEKSLPFFRRAVALSPSPESRANLADALLLSEHYAEAEKLFADGRQNPIQGPRVEVGYALCIGNRGAVQEAENILTRCIARHPAFARAYIALGNLYGQSERFSDAERILRQGVAAAPTKAEIHRLLGHSLHKQGRLKDAEQALRNALHLKSGDIQILGQLSEVLIDLNQLDEAETTLRQALATTPNDAGFLTVHGRIEELRGNLDKAIALHDRALAADPRHANALINRGSAKRFAADHNGALADYEAALTLKPDNPAAIANRALTYLTLGRLAEAWPDYRARIKALAGAPDLSAGRAWTGAPLSGKRVLVWTEYGLGDEILFASLVPEIIALTGHCTLVCSARLQTLFARSFPNATVVAMGTHISDDYDIRMPLTDAARLLRPSLEAFPSHRGYLTAEPSLVENLRTRYQTRDERKVVGLSWRSASGPTGRFKSTALAQWREILKTPGISFVSLQYGDHNEEIAEIAADLGVTIIVDPTIDPNGDMDAFAAQVSAMDLVLSVSNTAVHFAGGLNVPAWVLTPSGLGAHWYWFLERSDSPWYPSIKLFRQATGGDWTKPIRDVAAALTRWAADGGR